MFCSEEERISCECLKYSGKAINLTQLMVFKIPATFSLCPSWVFVMAIFDLTDSCDYFGLGSTMF